MKNKIIAFLLMFCLIIPFSCVLITGCGHQHTYSNIHDTTCDECGEVRTTEEHFYTNDHDSICDGCGEIRTINGLSLWDGTVGVLPADVNKKIEITTAGEFAAFAQAVNNGNTFEEYTIELTVDIDLNNLTWSPIGYGYTKSTGGAQNILVNTGKEFNGVFDGKEHTIYNLKVPATARGGWDGNVATAGTGLFGHIEYAEIKNINIDGADVYGNHYVAAVCGFALRSTVSNCNVKNANIVCEKFDDIEETGDKTGCIAGYIYGDATNCSAENSTVKAARDAGQLIGSATGGYVGEGNTAENVVVSFIGVGANTNIKNEIVGRG